MLKLRPIALSLLTTVLAPAAMGQTESVQVEPSEMVFLEADTLLDDRENGQLIAEGNVIAKFELRELRADKIVYTVESKIVRASGNVRIRDEDGSIRFADEIEVDDRLGDSIATGFSAQLPQDAIVVARAVSRKGNGTNTLDHAVYTACEVCEDNNYTPTWSVRARRAVQNAETKMITYDDAVFEVKGVPILYLPYFAHPDPSSERRSGFLPPTPKLSSTLGFVYEQPYYWAISESQDLTITPKLHTNVNPTLGLEYRKRFYSGFLEADVSMAYDFLFNSQGDRQFLNEGGRIVSNPDPNDPTLTPSEEEFRGHIFANGQFDINENWMWGFGIARTSDDLYLRRYGLDNREKDPVVYGITGQNMSSQLYTVRQTLNSYADAALVTVQSTREGFDDDTLGVATPIAFAEQLFDLGNNGILALQGSALFLNRKIGDDTRRFTTMANWQNSYIAPAGLIFEPELRARMDYYDYTIDATPTSAQFDDEDTRTSAMAAATLRWPLINRQRNVDFLVEPIVTVAYSEVSVDNGILPNEDSTIFEYTSAVAFEADPFTNFDLIESGGRIAAGLRGQADFRNGLRIDGGLARRWRQDADPAFAPASNLSGTESDYLVNAGIQYGKLFNLYSGFRVNDDFELLRTELTGELEMGRLKTSATYFDLRSDASYSTDNLDGVEGIRFKANYQLSEHFSVVFAQSRNIQAGENIERTFGLSIGDDCSFLRFSYTERDFDDRGVGSGDIFQITFGLKTIGAISDRTFD